MSSSALLSLAHLIWINFVGMQPTMVKQTLFKGESMETIIDQIHYDHISMSKVLNLMEREVHSALGGVDLDLDLLIDSMRYMINYSDTVHHRKEDAIFDRLSQLDEGLAETIEELHQQHASLAKLGAKFYDIVTNASLGEVVSKQAILSMGQDYIKFLRQHMRIEEGDVLRKAKQLLSDQDMQLIDQQYSEFRDPLLSEELEREYGVLYKHLLI